MTEIKKSATGFIGEVLERADSWINEWLQLGGARDPSVYTRMRSRGPGLDDGTLEALWVEDALSARIVELIVRHGMRKRWDLRLPLSPQDAAAARTAYRTEEERLDLTSAFAVGAWCGRLFGGGLTWIGVDDGEGIGDFVERQRMPLRAAAPIDRVMFLHSFDRREAVIEEGQGDPRAPGYRNPSLFKITPTGFVGSGLAAAVSAEIVQGGILVHESRLIAWPGAPTSHRRRTERSGWDDSVLERAWEALRQAGEDYGAKSQLLARISQFVFKIKGLGALLVGDERKFNRRMSLLDASRSRGRSLVMDVEESVENITQPVAGIDGIIDKSLERVATAAGIPPGLFIGRPTELEREAWNDDVQAWQDEVLRPRHEKVAALILRSKKGPTKGAEPDAWSIEYRPLVTPKPAEQAELRKLQAETDAIEIDKGIISSAAVKLHRHSAASNGFGEVILDEEVIEAARQREKDFARKPPKDNAELGTAAARSAGQVGIVEAVGQGRIPWASGKAILMQTFGAAEDDAIATLPPEGWRAAASAPARPGPAPAPPKGEGAGAPQGLPGFDDGGNPDTKALPPEGAR